MQDDKTFFGFQTVDAKDKAAKVRGVFDSVASRYDLMNDLMSAGVHRLWKRHFVGLLRLKPGMSVLDVAGGTGDITRLVHPQLGTRGQIILTDINHQMLTQGKARLVNEGLCSGLSIAQADAECLPFENASFDRVTIAFGLRNVTDKAAALKEFYRVLKPAGRLLVLEFSHPTNPTFQKIYDTYSFNVIPQIGKFITGDKNSYQYLVESIRKHPDQKTLEQMLTSAGFEHANYWNLTGGVVAIHQGVKL